MNSTNNLTMNSNMTASIPPSFSTASTSISLPFSSAYLVVVVGHVFGVVYMPIMAAASVSHGLLSFLFQILNKQSP